MKAPGHNATAQQKIEVEGDNKIAASSKKTFLDIIKVVWCPSPHMISDLLTKPTFGKQFKMRRYRLLGWGDPTEAEYESLLTWANSLPSNQRGVRAYTLLLF